MFAHLQHGGHELEVVISHRLRHLAARREVSILYKCSYLLTYFYLNSYFGFSAW